MITERTASEFVIHFPFTADSERMQDMIDYLRYKELTINYSVAQSEVDNFAQAINRKVLEIKLVKI
jgi:pyruvate/2-oxoacid:ferredoxin oxidoreductase alpha subunit